MIPLIISGSLVLWLIWLVASERNRVPDKSLMVPVAAAIIFGATGLVFRLHGFDRSLWLDEFGTLWAIEGSLGETAARVIGFHGQSPLYYLIVWPVTHWLGESEILLRLPSFIFGLASVGVVYLTCRRIAGQRAALFGASVAWISVPMTAASANARPYALAMLLVAVAFFGFVGAVLDGRLRYRLCFIIGGSGLFLTHYIYSPLLLGIGASYLLFDELRQRYVRRAFVLDVACQVALAIVAAPQVFTLWSRRGSLVWIDSPNYLLFLDVLVPLAVPALVGPLARYRSQSPALESALWLSIGAQVVCLSVLSAAGTNVLVPRYLDIVAVPAAVLAGLNLARVPALPTMMAAWYLFAVSCHTAVVTYGQSGHFVALPHQDWREAVLALQTELASRPGPVLYRSGFVEQTQASISGGSPLGAPLRSPGHAFPDLPIVSIPYLWNAVGAESHRERVVANSIAGSGKFYLLTGFGYADAFVAWLDVRFNQQINCQPLGDFGNVDLMRCGRDGADERAIRPRVG
jgi:hypothetical protein